MTRRIDMYSSIDSVTEMTSGNLVHGSCMVTHGSGIRVSGRQERYQIETDRQ